MPEVPKRNFTGGELAPALHARADLTKYNNGLATLRNFIIHAQGGVSNRAGTHYIDEVRRSNGLVRLIPFEFNKEQAYILEFGDQYMRVIRNDGIVLESDLVITGATQANPVVITAATHGFNNGDEVFIDQVAGMTELNGNRYIVANQTANTFALNGVDGTTFGTYIFGGTVARLFTLTTPYLEQDLPLLKFTQSADVMTIVHPSYQQRNLSRTGHSAWSLDVISYVPTIAAPTGISVTAGGGGGGAETKTYEYVVTAIAENGEESLQSLQDSVNTVSLDGTHFAQINWNAVTEADYYNVYKAESETSDVYGWIGESKTTTYRDYNLLPDVSDTPAEARDPFANADDYPSCVTYYQQRQIFGRTNNNTQTVFASQSGNFTSMRLSRPARADDSIERTIASRTVNEIRHFVDLDSLLVLTSGGEWIMTEGQDEVLTPSSAGFRRQTAYGASHVPPLTIGDSALFVQIGGRRVRDIAYTFQSDAFSGSDLSLLASHLFEGRTVKEWDYAQEPDGIVWVVMDDGDMIALTYQKEHQVWGWHRHDTDGDIESVAVIPDGPLDAVYFVVKRTINGQTKRYIEKLDQREFDTAADAFFVDCGLTYDGVPATTISGLEHLEAKAVAVLADGVVYHNLVVTGGAITLPTAASKVHVGLPYVSDLETLDLDFVDPQAISRRGKPISVSELVIKLLKSRGGFAGPSLDNLVEIRPRRVSDGYDPIELRTEEVRPYLPADWSANGRVFVRQTDPLPMTVLSIVPEFSVG